MASRPAPSAEFSELEPISISRIGTWASCQTKGYLRYRLKEKPVTYQHYFITGGLLHEVIEDYYNGANDSLRKAIQSKILTSLTEKGVSRPSVVQAIAAAKNETELIEKFRSGEITKPDGSKYSSPRMTTAWKQEAAKLGLDRAVRELASVTIPGCELPKGGLIELVSRIFDLASRYEDTLLVKREWLEEIHPEIGFDFISGGVRFLGYMDLVAKVKPEYRHLFGGKAWILVDYKTGKAHDIAEHQQSAHESLQLSLYHHAITEELKLCPPDELYMALHYVDAAFAAVTQRTNMDIVQLVAAGQYYQKNCDNPGLVKRFYYDGDDCKRCELRDSCIKHFGYPTSASTVVAPPTAEEELDWSF